VSNAIVPTETLQQKLLAHTQDKDEFFYDKTNSRVNDLKLLIWIPNLLFMTDFQYQQY
jgi:hypothetical protein